MTQNELLAHLKLGLKMTRKAWKGYLYIKDGKIFKKGEASNGGISVDLKNYFHPHSDNSDWQVYHEPEGS